jgi:hypothetical protein
MGDISKLELGPARVEMGEDAGTLVDMGFTKGGITMTIETETAQVTSDQFGTVVMKDILVGRNVTLTIPFAETDLQKLSSIIPLASVSISGVFERADINTPVGADLVESAARLLRLTKSIGDSVSDDPNDAFVFYKVAAQGAVEVNFSIEDQRIWEVEARCYPDASNAFSLGVFGDHNITP